MNGQQGTTTMEGGKKCAQMNGQQGTTTMEGGKK